MAQDNPPQTKVADDTKFFITIAVLLVLIIATLAALWMRERSARRDAQSQLNEFTQAALPDQLNNMLAQMAITRMPSTKPIDRADLQVRTVNLDGQSRQAFTVSPAAGERMGFLPGDVVIVAQPASQPATQDTPTTAEPTTMPVEVE